MWWTNWTPACTRRHASTARPVRLAKTNPKGAQLIATTHDTNLLRSPLLRRDQVWFTEKDGEGVTHLYPLTDFELARVTIWNALFQRSLRRDTLCGVSRRIIGLPDICPVAERRPEAQAPSREPKRRFTCSAKAGIPSRRTSAVCSGRSLMP